jgi:hypothetical protein
MISQATDFTDLAAVRGAQQALLAFVFGGGVALFLLDLFGPNLGDRFQTIENVDRAAIHGDGGFTAVGVIDAGASEMDEDRDRCVVADALLGQIPVEASVPLASEDSQIGVRMRVCRYGQDRAHPSCS